MRSLAGWSSSTNYTALKHMQAPKSASSDGERAHRRDMSSQWLITYSVHAYDVPSARLILRQHYPATAKSVPTAVVDVENLVDSLDPDILETGTWLNVMGYVCSKPEGVKLSRKARVGFVDATRLWSAGTIRLEKYQAAVEGLQQCIVEG